MAEPAELAERFISALPDKLAVALDPEGKAMEAYAVRALPFSVVIGKDGRLRSINAGDLRGFKDRFKAQLDDLLKGE
jgi:hypothetical protein